MQLYAWQEECLLRWKENKYRGIANVITGAGKTMLAMAAAIELISAVEAQGRELRIRIVVPTGALAIQWRLQILENLPGVFHKMEVSQYGGNRRDKVKVPCTVYVVNSARYTISRHIAEDLEEGYRVFLIADECHHYGSPENRKIFDFRNRCRNADRDVFTLGLSATPECENFENILLPALGNEIYRYDFERGAAERTISAYWIGQIALSFSQEELYAYDELTIKLMQLYRQLVKEYPYLARKKGKDFFREMRQLAREEEDLPAVYMNLSYQRAGISQNAVARVECVNSLVQKISTSERIIIFSERIEQAEKMYQVLKPVFPGRVGRYHSGLASDIRKNELEIFRRGEYRILITCRAMDEGIDVPEVSVGIVLSSTAASRQRIQRLGRILRRAENKERAVLYYLFIKEALDDVAYLPDRTDASRIFYLEYDRHLGAFENDRYEEKAECLFEKAMEKLEGREQIDEMKSCLEEGLVRADWLLKREQCQEKIEAAQNRHERNYWICMKRLADDPAKEAEAEIN